MSTKLDAPQAIQLVTDEPNEALRIHIVASDIATGGTSAIDESTFTPGVTTFTPSGGVYNDTLAPLTTGDVGVVRMTPDRAFHINLRNDSGTEIATSANPLRTDPTGTTPQPASQSGTWNINNVSGAVSLPTGASTLTAQNTGNVSLSSIDGKTPALGQALAAGSTPVVLTASQISTLTPLTTVTVIQPTGSNLHVSVDSSTLPSGSATSANQATEITNLGFIVTSSQQAANNTAALNLTPGTTTAGSTGPMVLGAVTTTAPSYSSGQVNPLSLNTAGSLRTEVTSSVLPSGASTSALQTAGNASVASLDSKTVHIDTGNVTVVSNALPSGAATAANQSIELTRLSGSLVPTAYNEIDLTYVPSGNGTGQIATAVYKLATVTQKTLTLSYDSNNRLTSVIAS